MSTTCSIIPLIVFSAFVILCRGQCGFPGQPFSGTAHVFLNPNTLQHFDWNNVSLTTHSGCDKDHLLVPEDFERRCVDGKWTGQVPQCVQIKRNEELYNFNNTVSVKFKEGCSLIQGGNVYKVSLIVSRRLFAIRLSTAANDWENLKTANWSLEFLKENRVKWQQVEIADEQFDVQNFRVLLSIKKIIHRLKSIRFKSSSTFLICGVETLTYYDECGHPEIPLHGSVRWNPDDTVATYKCAEGYRLESNSSTRHCIDGQWNGSEPICASKDLPFSSTSSSSASRSSCEIDHRPYALVVICGGLMLLVLAICVLVLFRSNRLPCLIKAAQQQNSNYSNLEEVEAVDAESAERIRQNRQSRREWMERNSPIYAELDSLEQAGGIETPDMPIYAQVDKSKKRH